MASRCVLQIFRQTARVCSSSVSSRVQYGVPVRLLSSSSIRRTLPTNPSKDETPPLAPELTNASLLDMGFTDEQVEEIHDSMSTVRGNVKHTLPTLTFLFGLGLNNTSVAKIFKTCPELHTIQETILKQRLNHLRKLGFVEGSLQRVVAKYPIILTVPVKTVKQVVMCLREQCLFTLKQVTDILRHSPAVVLEDLEALQYKFQYVYFRMGIKQSEMMKAKMFRCSLDKIRCRHSFMERRGFYQTPDKKGHTLTINPKLENILCVNLDTFLQRVAKATEEEYDIFKRMVEREWQEEELQLGDVEADDDDDDDDDDEDDYDDDEEEYVGKKGYMKGKRKH